MIYLRDVCDRQKAVDVSVLLRCCSSLTRTARKPISVFTAQPLWELPCIQRPNQRMKVIGTDEQCQRLLTSTAPIQHVIKITRTLRQQFGFELPDSQIKMCPSGDAYFKDGTLHAYDAIGRGSIKVEIRIANAWPIGRCRTVVFRMLLRAFKFLVIFDTLPLPWSCPSVVPRLRDCSIVHDDESGYGHC